MGTAVSVMNPKDERIAHVLESQGFRELVSANLFATGVALAPSIDDKHMLADHAREELGHFEIVAGLYEQVAGKPLFDVVASRASEVPSPSTWLEAAVAGYLIDRAAAVQLRDYKRVEDPRLDAVIDQILEHEHEHMAAAETALVDQCRADPVVAKHAEVHVARWFSIAKGVLDEGPDAPRIAEDFAASIRSALAAAGLSLAGRAAPS